MPAGPVACQAASEHLFCDLTCILMTRCSCEQHTGDDGSYAIWGLDVLLLANTENTKEIISSINP